MIKASLTLAKKKCNLLGGMVEVGLCYRKKQAKPPEGARYAPGNFCKALDERSSALGLDWSSALGLDWTLKS